MFEILKFYLSWHLKKKTFEKNFLKIIKKFGPPDASVNCYYPKSIDWKYIRLRKLPLKASKENLKINLITTCLSKVSCRRVF